MIRFALKKRRIISWQTTIATFLYRPARFLTPFFKRNQKTRLVRLGGGQAWPSITRSLWCLHIDCLLLRVCASCHVPRLTVQTKPRTVQDNGKFNFRVGWTIEYLGRMCIHEEKYRVLRFEYLSCVKIIQHLIN